MSDASGIGGLQGLLSSVNVSSAKPVAAAKVSGDRDADQGIKAAGAAPSDRSVFSSASGLVAQALQTSEVRLEKVSALKQAIEAGAYNVPSAQVADKVISSMLRE